MLYTAEFSALAAARWLAPFKRRDRSPTGREIGKSTEASMIDKKMYQPRIAITKDKAPAATLQILQQQRFAQ